MSRLRPLLLALLLLTGLQAAEPQAGLAVTFTAGGKSDVRSDRLLALYVPAGQAPTPFLPAGPFVAKWEGRILSPVRGTFTFAAENSGGFKLSLNGQPLLDGATARTITLNQGENTLVAELPSAAQGDTFVRLTWSSKDFLPEPVPPTVLAHTPAEAELAATRVREGRLLFAQLNCAACHADAAKIPAKGTGMPELGQNAPVLAELGNRYNQHFLADWIYDPKSVRPGTLMPKAVTGPDAAQQAADIAAMLTQGATPPAGKLDAAQVAPGGALFANLGCIGCHQRPDAEVDGKPETLGRIPLAHLSDKYQLRAEALAAYLREPAKHYPATRMPNFRLSEEESGQLANYLLANGRMIKRQTLKGDPTRGAALLVSAGCLNCHAGMPPTTQPPLAKVLAAGPKGCLAPDGAGRAQAPDFGLAPAQREALLAFLATDLASLKQDTPAEFAERQARNLNCVACHTRDGQGSAWSKVDGECKKLRDALPAKEHVEGEPVPDAPIPAMTWFGEKLQTAWMTKFVSGQVEAKPRPWLIGRMPGFAHVAAGLSLGLAHQHGLPAEEPKEAAPKAELAALGEKLIGVDGGFNCITCHAVGDTPATAVFEAPAINFKETAERLRRGYFLRWVLAPTRLDPETKMPKYADAEGMTQLTDILDGKGTEQFDAVRQYLRTLESK
jgi:mono/diheme cytochrome c family protein